MEASSNARQIGNNGLRVNMTTRDQDINTKDIRRRNRIERVPKFFPQNTGKEELYFKIVEGKGPRHD